MIKLILDNANKAIFRGDNPFDALKTSCNQVLAYVSYENATAFEYEVQLFQGGSFPVSIDSGIWVQGWI